MNRRSFLTAATATTAAAVTCATPFTAHAAPASRSATDRRLLHEWFTATHRSMEAMTTELGLAADKIDVSGSGTPAPSAQTSPTNIGCGLWSTVAAAGLGVISETTMHRRLDRALSAVERLERAHGFWFNWYDAHDGSLLTTWPETGDPIRPFLSTVDNAWLVTGLRIAAHADPTLRSRVGALLADADWSYYYTPYDQADPVAGPGQLRGGYWPDKPGKGEPTGHHYGALNTEPRMASYLGIADGSLPTEHYWHLFRTLLPGAGQEQEPEGAYVEIDGVRVWEGHYTYRGRDLVPTWGGSMFEALMVPLFVPEAEWSPNSWGTTHERFVRSQLEHGLDEQGYGYWGFSPASIPEGGYREYGVDAIGMQEDGYHSLGVVTPHANFLALPQAPTEAVANLRGLDSAFGAYDDRYGFRDSVDVTTGRVSDFVLALDQGMITAALAQHLRPGLLQAPFRTGGFTGRVRPLLRKERFSI
ncbi:twin-arginine translocation signal domain-containing protein [Streptomyces sp. NBC_01017]|uniref:Twin-arginine translocation signal domain-containing protein n=1 Tax=Streptomyces sp. NBC_00180 TaxID=2903632 RepID=A0AAU1I6N0_9ACTN|nr:twin-arginine translocation signal domain-containing protein [Streptomyces sp. NBC_01017]